MNTKTFYIDIDKNRFLSEQGGLLTEWPTIAYSACPTWNINFVRPGTLGEFIQIDVSDAVSWHAAIDMDFDINTLPMVRTLDEDIDKSKATSGIIEVPLNAGTTTFQEKIGTQERRNAYFEVRGYNSSGYVIYDYRMPIYVLGSIDPQGNEPIELPSGYATEDWTRALLRAAPEYRFSADETNWHETRLPTDSYYQTRYPEGEWSESILIVNGEGGSVSGYATEEYVNEKLLEKQNVIDASNKLSYTLISDTPEIPVVNNSTITINQGGVTKGTFTLNQVGNATINIDAGGGGGSGQDNIIESISVNGTPQTITNKNVDISVPTVNNSTITINQGGVTKGTFTLNQDGNATINLDSGGGSGDENIIESISVNGTTQTITNKNVDISVPTSLSELSEDNNHLLVTSTEKATWNAKSDFSGKYADLSGTPTIPEVYNGNVTINQGGVTKGTFTLNQSGDTIIDLDSGGGSGGSGISITQAKKLALIYG